MLTSRAAQSIAIKAKLFRGLADPSRLSILESLCDGPFSVGELVETTGLSQSNTSNHLACLLGCGLVEREQQGRRVIYRLGEGVGGLLAMVDELLAGAASGVEACNRLEMQPVPLRRDPAE
jgi:DNA-binding transcriptional ArsR family regulator